MTKRKNKVAGYLRAVKLIDGGMTQYQACATAGISRMTFNKYRDMFGDEIKPNVVEILPKEQVQVKEDIVADSKKLQKLIEENSIMERNLALKKQLGLIQ